jgi:hypothetical protein
MTIPQVEPNTLPSVLAYAKFLRKLDELISEGKGDSQEAAALADAMDAPWYAMTAQEQARLSGLSGDLYALREGGPKRVDMAEEEWAKWQDARRDALARLETGDVDSALTFLRQPIPAKVPDFNVPFLQAMCWEKLGDLETALAFMKEAERQDPRFGVMVLWLRERLCLLKGLPPTALLNKLVE